MQKGNGVCRIEDAAPNGRLDCLLPKQKVVGSNPIARSNSLLMEWAGAKDQRTFYGWVETLLAAITDAVA